MATRNRLAPYSVIEAGDMSQATLTSAPTNILNLDNISYQLNFTGAPVGEFSIEMSLDYRQDAEGNVLNAGSWIPIDLSATPNANGSADQILINLTDLSAPWIRAVYTKTSGTGTLNAYISGKMV